MLDLFAPLRQNQPRALLWRDIAVLTRAFVEVETQGFDLLE